MNPFPSQPVGYANSDQHHFGTCSPTSPPPTILVSTAERRVRINPPLTPPPSQSPPPLPQYSANASPRPSQPRTLAQQEKEDYYARSKDATSVPRKAGGKVAPVPILLPPKAVFAQSESPLGSPVSLRQAQAFGDAGSIRSGSGVGLLGPGGGAPRWEDSSSGRPDKQETDWSRFSVLVNSSKSDWLSRKQGASKKWYVLGWIGFILLVVAIVVGVVVGVKHHTTDDGTPKIPDLGIFNSKEIRPASTTSANPVISTVPPRSESSPSSSGDLVDLETATTTTASLEEVQSSVVSTATPLAQAASESATLTRLVRTTVRSTSVSAPASQTSSVSPRTTTSSQPNSSSSASPSSGTASISTSTRANGSATSVHHRRFLNHASFELLRATFVDEAIGKVRRDLVEA